MHPDFIMGTTNGTEERVSPEPKVQQHTARTSTQTSRRLQNLRGNLALRKPPNKHSKAQGRQENGGIALPPSPRPAPADTPNPPFLLQTAF